MAAESTLMQMSSTNDARSLSTQIEEKWLINQYFEKKAELSQKVDSTKSKLNVVGQIKHVLMWKPSWGNGKVPNF